MVTAETLPAAVAGLSADDLKALEVAWRALEHPSFAARVSSIIGTPIEQSLRLLPRSWHARIHSATEHAIERAYEAAVASLDRSNSTTDSIDPHKALAVATGAIGGFFGLPALPVELPVTTLLMLRAIADTAHRHGEVPDDPETRFACLEVFALGGRAKSDDYAEIGYYEVRLGLGLHLARPIALTAGELPSSIGFLRAIASRFGVVVSDKIAAQMVPILGAAAGGLVNVAFMDHFQKVANGHFTIRRLERVHGRDPVETAYRAIGEAIENGQMAKRPAGAARRRPASPVHSSQ